jgi:glycogen debranching enzyme
MTHETKAAEDLARSQSGEIIRINNTVYVAANSQRANIGTHTLKSGDTFAVIDRLGEMGATGIGEQGLYHRGTRHLSQWEVLIQSCHPLLLTSSLNSDNISTVVHMTTNEVIYGNQDMLPHGKLHIRRRLTVDDYGFHEELTLTNYSRAEVSLLLEYRFAADFADIFEVRGSHREERGDARPAELGDHRVKLSYYGKDERLRATTLQFDGEYEPKAMTDRQCHLNVWLRQGESKTLNARIVCESDEGFFSVPFGESSTYEKRDHATTIETSNDDFNDWIARSTSDLEMLVTNTRYGPYPYAGVPWFATPFGRDAIITALQTLWVRPQLAHGVLNFLAATQADQYDDAAEAEPGKIFHEMRDGEMAALGEVPFRCYYGTVDATPLFVILAGYYYCRTGDRAFIERIWSNIERAIQWIDEYGDLDHDGFVEYQARNARGLVHQCWKDSNDSIFHADGQDALGPLAVTEVQGYVYEAKLLASEMARVIGSIQWSEKLYHDAAALRQRFNDQFWLPSIQTYALALDGDKRPCAVRSSNVGHLLFSGIVDQQHAAAVARTLTEDRSFTGWGIRTIAQGEARYNPMSYHNGTIWPHDTAICAAGLARYGFRKEATMIMTGLFQAAQYSELNRLPELFCGFDRTQSHGPTLWPVACSPQAWAAGSVFLLLQSTLGLSFSPTSPQVRFGKPQLPPYLNWVRIKNLQVGGASVDLCLWRHPHDVGLSVERKEGDLDIIVMG